MKEELKKYPVVIIFFVFLFSFSFLDSLWPKRERSELENRSLAQYPTFSFKGIMEKDWDNSWMSKYDKYIKDQFIVRDDWIDIKSRCEGILLKLENNKVWYGGEGTMFQKLTSVNEKQILANTQSLVSFAQRHTNAVTMMIVPSASLVLEHLLPFKAPIVDESKYLDNIYNSLSTSGANAIDLRVPFAEKQNSLQLYYKTDHHWTTDGAYFAYEQFAKARELMPFDKARYTENLAENFYGTNYSKARKYGTMPDSIKWYDIPNTLTVYKIDGFSEGDTGSIYNATKWESRDKYGAFLRGNNGYSILNGNGEGSILIIKDSYANSFIPFLVDNYAKIGIVDLRATMLNIDELMVNEEYDEALILYNFQTFSTDTFIRKLN